MGQHDSLEDAGRVLFWPQILFDDDLARIFKISRRTARKRLAVGDFGLRFRVGRRWAVRKEALIRFLAAREEAPHSDSPADGPRPFGRDRSGER